MFKNLKLRNKILIPVVLVCAGVFAIIMTVVQMQIQEKSIQDMRQQGEEISARYAAMVQGKIDAATAAAKVLAAAVGNERAQDSPNRAVVAGMLHRTLESLPEVFGVWTAWEPNAFDGKDKDFVNANALHEATGRFLPYVIRGEKGIEETHTTTTLATSRDNGERWYWQPLQTRKLLLVEPTVYEVAGKDRMMASVCVPIPGKGMGVAGLDLSLEGLQHLATDIRVFNSGYGVLLSNTGMIVAHQDKNLIGKQVDAVLSEDNRAAVKHALQQGVPLLFSQKSRLNDQDMLFCMTPVRLEGVDGAWSFVIALPKAVMLQNVRDVQNLLVVLSVGGLVLLAVATFLIARAIVRPVKRIMEATQAVAAGDLDRPIALRQRDEIGTMADSVRSMVRSLKGKISEADEKTRLAHEESQRANLATRDAEQARAVAEQAKAQGMLQAAGKLDRVVGIVSLAAEELSAQIEQSTRGAEGQAARAGETATAMDEMTATVVEIAKNASLASETANNTRIQADAGGTIVSQAIQGISDAQEQALGLKEDMTVLGRQAEGIGQILNVISDIADQTNLLALNAAIEAARAGEAGRGFAVVADEVRKLAEKTMTATKEVGAAITAIQAGTRKNIDNVDQAVEKIQSATALATQSGDALARIFSLVETTSGQVASIATAAEQQSATCEEINRSIESMSQLSAETSDVMRQSAQAILELANQAQELSALVDSLKKDALETAPHTLAA